MSLFFRKKEKDKNRIVMSGEGVFMLFGYVQDDVASRIIKEMLDFSDKNPHKVITIYIDSQGGDVSAGIAIYDVMRYLPNPISTICYGETMGISCLILSAGTQGMRFACPNARIALGEYRHSAKEMEVPAIIDSVMQKIYCILAENMRTTVEQVKEMMNNNSMLSADEAIKAGLIDSLFIQ